MTASEEEEAEQGRMEEHGEQHEGVGREQGPEKGVVEQPRWLWLWRKKTGPT